MIINRDLPRKVLCIVQFNVECLSFEAEPEKISG